MVTAAGSPASGAREGNRQGLSQYVFDALREALRAGQYRPGDRLREEEVAHRLKVSRTPVREAFSRLLAKRLVEPASGRGLVVRRLGSAEVFELYAMREILEGAAARLSAQHGAPVEHQVLADVALRFAAVAPEASDLAADLNHRFHDTLYASARNHYLDAALQEMQDAIALLGPTTYSVPGRHAEACREHAAIVEAVTARDADVAEQVARDHIRRSLAARVLLLHG
ncbi:GntR family transcriptional regulator [Aurantimonas marina]|uniref:GntR family transcriptional regulator n=1 Tax=Aurantimonas marina TaxID=2780508 RepID=UPI0019D0C094|nr:GntR family transcriptional regulator [Aurantimonas marina]